MNSIYIGLFSYREDYLYLIDAWLDYDKLEVSRNKHLKIKEKEEKMKGLSKLLATGLAAALLLTLVPAVALAGEDSVSGTFKCNAAPTVSSVTLTDGAMTPQTEYTVTVAVGDADNLSDLSTLVLKVWYDSNGGAPTEGEYDAAAANTQTGAVITYTVLGDSFVIDPTGASTTWALGTCTEFDAGEKAATSGDCLFVFTPGKVATKTDGSAVWQVAVKITDSGSQTAFDYDSTPGATMAWYGEVAVTPTSVDFGTLVKGTAFDSYTPQTVYDTSGVNYIANGAYDEKVKATSSWGTATLEIVEKAPSAMTADTFSLKADDTATLGSAVMVDTTGATIDDTDGLTTEAGDDVDNNNLWIQLASSFTSGEYNGNIYYIIAAH